MTPAEQFVRMLEELKEGECSRLRRLVGRSLDASLVGFDLFTGLWWPLRHKSPKAPRREPSWLVAKLWGTFAIPHARREANANTEWPTLPAVLGKCEPPDEHGGRRFRDRFDVLLCSPLYDLESHLRWALSEVARAVAGRVPHAREIKGMDWAQLLDDISIWDKGEIDIREKWIEVYLKFASKTNRRKSHVD